MKVRYGAHGAHLAARSVRFAVPAGHTRRVRVTLTARAYAHARRARPAVLTVELRTDDGDRSGRRQRRRWVACGNRVRPWPPRGSFGTLVAQIEDELDAVVDRIADRIREDIPDFRRLPTETLAQAVHGNVSRALAALRELRDPTPDELERAAAVGRERAEQGLTVDAVLHAYRISVTGVWSRFGELAREQGADVATVLAFSRDPVALGRRGDGHRGVRAPRGRARAGARGAAAPRRVRVRAADRDARPGRAAPRERHVRARPRARVRAVPGARADEARRRDVDRARPRRRRSDLRHAQIRRPA